MLAAATTDGECAVTATLDVEAETWRAMRDSGQFEG
jgi:hypothetical protein